MIGDSEALLEQDLPLLKTQLHSQTDFLSNEAPSSYVVLLPSMLSEEVSSCLSKPSPAPQSMQSFHHFDCRESP